MHKMCPIHNRAAPVMVSVSVSGQYQYFLMVSESVKYAIYTSTNSVVYALAMFTIMMNFMHQLKYFLNNQLTYIINYDCILQSVSMYRY